MGNNFMWIFFHGFQWILLFLTNLEQSGTHIVGLNMGSFVWPCLATPRRKIYGHSDIQLKISSFCRVSKTKQDRKLFPGCDRWCLLSIYLHHFQVSNVSIFLGLKIANVLRLKQPASATSPRQQLKAERWFGLNIWSSWIHGSMDQASLSQNLPMNMARSSGFSKSPSASSLFAPRVPERHAQPCHWGEEGWWGAGGNCRFPDAWLILAHLGSVFWLFWTTNGWPCRGR